jgi:uncharacterized protein YpiB (UPF0302 family)
MEFPPMKSFDEVQKTHDLLSSAMEHVEIESESKELLNTITTVLCWVLNHEEGTKMDALVSELDSALRQLGFSLVRASH